MAKTKLNGFTLVEVLVVIATIGLLSVVAVVSFSGARLRSRDSKRVAYVKQVSSALELYYLQNGYYPTTLTSGQNLVAGTTTYLNPVPSNPTPRTDGSCPNQNFVYNVKSGNQEYDFKFCLGGATSSYPSGTNVISQGGTVDQNRPDTVSGLLLWLKADWLNLNDGDTVSSWTDASGNNNHATAATAANRPTFKKNIINGKPVLRYDGNSDVLVLTTLLTTVRQAFIVMKWDNQVIDYVPILGGTTTYDYHGPGGASGVIIFYSYTSACVLGGSAWNNGTSYGPTLVPKDKTNFQLVELQPSCNTTVGNISNDRGSAARSIHGDIAEVILYNTTLSTTDRQKVERYLRDKYKLTIAGI